MLFLDTSALVKRYVEEEGTGPVLELMNRDRDWSASALCLSEARITLCHLPVDEETASRLADALEDDWDRLFVVPVDELCLSEAIELGCRHRLRTLDAVHLAAAGRIPGPVTFVSFDGRQLEAASALGLALADLKEPPRL